jgi:hypothetical protein
VVPFFKDGRRAEDGMYMRTHPLGIRGTGDGHELLRDDFDQDGAAWTAALVFGRPDNSWPAPLLLHPRRKIKFQLWSND